MAADRGSWLDNLQKASLILIPLVGAAFTWITYIDQQHRVDADKVNQDADKVNQQRRADADKVNQQQELYVKMLSEREKSDAEMRARIFETLIRQYQETAAKEPREQIPLIEMLVLNFHDSLNVSPLLKSLAARLARDGDREGIARLQKAAKKMARRQVEQIQNFRLAYDTTRYPHTEVLELPVRRRDADAMDRSPILVNDPAAPSLEFRVVNLGDDRVEMQLHAPGRDKLLTFEVSYYDLPLIDNTSIPGHRVAFVLQDIKPRERKAEVVLVMFPQELTGARDRPFVESMMEHLRSLGKQN